MKILLPSGWIIAVFFCLWTIKSKAQPNSLSYIPTIFPKSPNSAAFAKYGDYEVNLYSGVPEISIPLYTVEAGGLQVPVTLSYHASGLKVDEVASSVGAGWSLSAGGSITRNIMGGADENGYFNYYKGIQTLNIYTQGGMDSLYNIILNHNRNYDMRPDIYNYNVPGHSGKFFFNGKNNFKVITIPYAPLNIKKAAGSPFSFNITDEHGNTFIIGKNTTETTTTYYTSGSGSGQAVTAWMLESMISQNRRDTINFSYFSQAVAPPDQTGQTATVEDLEQTTFTGYGCPVPYANGNPVTVISDVASDMNEQEIQHITFKNGRVDFIMKMVRGDMTDQPLALDTMKVFAYNYGLKKYELQKSIVFFHAAYFKTVNNSQGKLKLDSIQILDKGNSVTQRYKFKYNLKPTADYLSYSKDLWGYYNGSMDSQNITNKTLIPRTTVQTQNNGNLNNITIGADVINTRLPDSTFMQAGVLDTIYYPTGGYTTFTYQTNRYFDAQNNMYLTGGLRVTSINSYDGINVLPKTKTYQYNASSPNFITNASGQLSYGFFSNTQTHRYWVNTANPNDQNQPPIYKVCKTKRVRTYFSDPSNSLTPSEGAPVGYTNVTEYNGTPVNNAGKSIYTYNATTDYTQSASASGIPIVFDYSFSRGQMLHKTDYRNNGDGTYSVVKDVGNTYTNWTPVNYDAVGVAQGQTTVNEGVVYEVSYNQLSPDDTNNYPFGNYSIVSDDNYLTSTTTTQYDINDVSKYTASTTTYHYDDTTHQQVVSVTHVDSKGNTLTTNNKYAYNFPLSGGSTGSIVLDSMINRHMWADEIEKTQTITYVTNSNTMITGAELNNFQRSSLGGAILPSSVSILKISAPIATTSFTPSSVVSGNLSGDSKYTQMISFDSYDAKNNISQYTPRNSPPVTILWDYLYSLPVAQVKNAYSSSNYSAYTSFEADGNGGWYYNGHPQNDATAPSGTYVYPLSSGSITSPYYDATKAYVLSYWSNNGAASVTAAGSSVTGTALRTAGGWVYYEHQVPAGTGTAQLTISGTGINIDELRLYALGAQMTSYAYDPSGIRSIDDTKGQISYFEYDPFQRLKNIKDWNGYIVKNYGYHTYDQTIGNDAIAATAFTRNNCPAGTTPTAPITYSEPANKYYAFTKAAANAEAQYDLQTTGQYNANVNCGCPIQTVTFTFSNTSGTNGYQAVFSGTSSQTVNFPNSGSSSVTAQIPVGTYTINIGPVGSFSHTFQLGSQTPATGHLVTYNNVNVATGSTTLSISITP